MERLNNSLGYDIFVNRQSLSEDNISLHYSKVPFRYNKFDQIDTVLCRFNRNRLFHVLFLFHYPVISYHITLQYIYIRYIVLVTTITVFPVALERDQLYNIYIFIHYDNLKKWCTRYWLYYEFVTRAKFWLLGACDVNIVFFGGTLTVY